MKLAATESMHAGSPVWLTPSGGQAVQVAILTSTPADDQTQAYDGETATRESLQQAEPLPMRSLLWHGLLHLIMGFMLMTGSHFWGLCLTLRLWLCSQACSARPHSDACWGVQSTW